VLAATSGADRSFTYVYWPHLDRIGHESGVDSAAWRAALARVEELVSRLVSTVGSSGALVVTSDHGMVDCEAVDRIDLESDAHLMAGVRLIAGEPRARHVYVEDGAADDVAAAWRALLGDRVQVRTRGELVEQGWFGDVDPALEERIGDVMAIANGGTVLASRVDATVSGLRGQHGAVTPEELLIPALLRRAE
jgi:hypothetical protein